MIDEAKIVEKNKTINDEKSYKKEIKEIGI